MDTQGPLGPPEMKEVPSGIGFSMWWVLGALAVVAVMVVGTAVVWRFLGFEGQQGTNAPVAVPVTSAPPEPTASVAATATTASAAPTITPATVPTTPIAPVKPGARADAVAYRKDGAVWVSRQSGGAARKVTTRSGPFALSPDGAKLAVVDPNTKSLAIVDVATQRTASVGSAEPLMPVWSTDSATLVYTTAPDGTPRVARVSRAGTDRRILAEGRSPAFSLDGKTVFFLRGATGESGQLASTAADGGGVTDVAGASAVSAFAPLRDGLVWATNEAGAAVLKRSGFDGSGATTLVRSAPTSKGVSYSDLSVAPGGARIAYAETGDDGYSRLWMLPVAGGKALAVSGRLDAYPLTWSPDGSRILFVQGNAFQGEPTEVVSLKVDGTGRLVVAKGGGL